MNYWNTFFCLCVHTCFQCSAEISCKRWNRTLNKTRNKDFYTTFSFSLLHLANLMNMKPSSCSSECFCLWVSANFFYFLNESRGYQEVTIKETTDSQRQLSLQPHFIIQLFSARSSKPQQKLRMAVWDKNLLWSFMFLLAGKTDVLFWSCFSGDQWKQGSEFSFDSLLLLCIQILFKATRAETTCQRCECECRRSISDRAASEVDVIIVATLKLLRGNKKEKLFYVTFCFHTNIL